MAYVAPNSTIKLLARVPLNNNYDETVWYSTPQAQYADMTTYLKLQLTAYSYQRHGRDYIRVTVPNVDVQHPTPVNNAADALFDVNYMMFQNTNFGNKWFYAFVLDVEYINNSVAELKYEIDVMQTFMFDYTMPRVYVEREHSATDEIGDNLIDEKITTGEAVPYDNKKYQIGFDYSSVTIYIMYIINKAKLNVLNTGNAEFWEQNMPIDGGNFYNNIFSGCNYASVSGNISTAAGITALRQAIQNKIQLIETNFATIVAMLEMPNNVVFSGGIIPGQSTYVSQALSLGTLVPQYHWFRIPRPTTFKFSKDVKTNYTPKNNKLYTYPYSYIQISNREGEIKHYKYEYFKDITTLDFDFTYATVPNFEHLIKPNDYIYYDTQSYGMVSAPDLYLHGASLPLPTFSEDSYNLWKAQKSSALSVDILGNVLNAGIMALATYASAGTATVGMAAGLATAGVGAVSSLVSNNISAKDAPDIYRGSQLSSEIMCGLDTKGYDITCMQVKPSIAKQIDDYFTMYGYACREMKIPNIFSVSRRPYWNYVKTVGCNIHPAHDYTGHQFSGIPMNYVNKINSIWDNGIRFWMDNLSGVDDYSRDNSPD